MAKWYLVHLGIQCFGLALALAAFLIAVTQFNPIPRSLAHFQLGLAVMILALLQPLNSLPRLTMHHVSHHSDSALTSRPAVHKDRPDSAVVAGSSQSQSRAVAACKACQLRCKQKATACIRVM